MQARNRQIHCRGFHPLRLLERGLLAAFLLVTSTAVATTRYVNLNNPTPASPYTTWATAATTIQDALAPAIAGDLILVLDGTYATGSQANSGLNRVNINKAVTVQSVNGPSVTVIQGLQTVGTGVNNIRCVLLASNATLSGFTLLGGGTQTTDSGAGVKCESTNSVVTNCVIAGNVSGIGGGGVYSGTVVGCTVSGNTALAQGGGGTASSIVRNSILSGNVARSAATGAGGAAYAGSLMSCLIYNNLSASVGGAAASATLVNCTVANNVSYGNDGAVSGGAAKNCIVYYNFARTNVPAIGSGRFTNCCAFPQPTGGLNNFTNPPLFLNRAALDFHLSPASPCINVGNNSYVTGTKDLDGLPRVVNSIVDLGAYEFQAIIHFVKTNKHTPVFPYTDWSSAATNIQDAIDSSLAGDVVVVSNGVYKAGGRAVYGTATNRITIDRAIVVQSVNGPSLTTIIGARTTNSSPSGIRCAFLTTNAVLIGFTLTNGCARTNGNIISEQSGGGVWCEDSTAWISNCVITGNSAAEWGGGAFRGALISCLVTNNTASYGGGAASNSLVSCTLFTNAAAYNNNNNFGGGAYYSTLASCVLIGNRGIGNGSVGGGTYHCDLSSCVLSNNSAGSGGGMAYGMADHSLISSNRAVVAGGGTFQTDLNNCVLQFNLANNGGGARAGTLNNCTLTANTAAVSGGGTFDSALNNCVLQFNFGGTFSNYALGDLNYCCTLPLPSAGWGNITNNPAFADPTTANFRLQISSPCINSGNNTYVTSLTDYDGLPRIVSGTVDIGAFESQVPGSIISYAYLQQYGLPLDGSWDYIDFDLDKMNTWMEWRAGTDPGTPKSVLKMRSINESPAGVTVTWQSVNTRQYFVQRATSLAAPVLFQTVATNLDGQTNSTSWLDTNALGPGPYFYRVGVQY